MSNEETKILQLKNKRLMLIEMQEREQLRSKYGKNLVNIIAKNAGASLSIEDFNNGVENYFPIVWTKKLSEAPGLVLTNLLKSDIDHLLNCFERQIGSLSGAIGFHEKPYFGFAKVKNVTPLSLRLMAEEAEDSVVLYNDSPAGVVMVDFYASETKGHFSALVQGLDLMNALKKCFENV